MVCRYVDSFGRGGLDKSESGNVDAGEIFVQNSRGTVLGKTGAGMKSYGVENANFATGKVLRSQDVSVRTGN